MQIYIGILQILSNQSARSFSIQELVKAMEEKIEVDEKEIFRKIVDLTEQKLVKKVAEGKRNTYQIEQNPLDKMEKEELLELYYALDFFAVKFPFRTPVIFLMETLEHYIKKKYHVGIEKKSLFIYEYNFLHTIFNDIITNDLVKAMEENKIVMIEE